MATYIKGDKVANATSYELFEKLSENNYNSLKTGNEINFDVSALGLEEGKDHILVVKAHASGYTSSDYSNEVVFSVAASGGSEGGDTGDSDVPTTTTWYVDHRNNVSKFTAAVNIAGRGWAHTQAGNAYAAYVGKPINALGIITNKASQTVKIGKVPFNGTEADLTIIDTVTITTDGTKQFAYAKFAETVVEQGEALAIFCDDNDDIQFYYASSGGPVTDANGIADGNFYGRVPKVYGSGTAWTVYTDALTLGVSIGYVV